jgi:hypothetical protein
MQLREKYGPDMQRNPEKKKKKKERNGAADGGSAGC